MSNEIQQQKAQTVGLTVIVVLIYLFVEWIYNQHLLQVMMLLDVNQASFTKTEVFGKLIASFGINLFLWKVFHYQKRFFLIGFVAGYFLLTSLFNYAIDSFSDSFRHKSHYMMLNRTDVLSYEKHKEIEEKVARVIQSGDTYSIFDRYKPTTNDNNTLLTPDSKAMDSWYNKSLIMAYFALTMDQDKWQNYETKLTKAFDDNKAALDKNALWLKYQKMNDLGNEFGKAYSKYRHGMYLYNLSPPSRYAENEFLKRSGGIPPNLDEQDFLLRLPHGGEYYNYMTRWLFSFDKIDSKLNKYAFTGSDIPRDLTYSQFSKFIDSKVDFIKTSIMPSQENIRRNTDSDNTVAVLVIPAISIGLSLLSIFLNVFLLVTSILFLSIEKKAIPYSIAACLSILLITYFIYSYQFNYNQKWNAAEIQAKEEHPILANFWRLTFRFEPLLCLDNPSTIANRVTEKFYLSTGRRQTEVSLQSKHAKAQHYYIKESKGVRTYNTALLVNYKKAEDKDDPYPNSINLGNTLVR